MRQLVHLLNTLLEHNEKTQGFDPAAGRAYAAAKKAGAQQQENGVCGPLGIVGGRKAVIGHHRTGKEEGVHQAIRGVVHPCMPDLPGGDDNNHRGGAQKEFNLRAAANRFQGASDNGDVPEGEVERGEQ